MTALHQPLTQFAAPTGRTSREPAEHRGLARDGVRLLIARTDTVHHDIFRNLGDHLVPGDLLVVNDSRTRAAEVDGTMDGGWPTVVHFASELTDGTWVVELRTAPDASRPILTASRGEVVRLESSARLRLIEPYPRPNASPSGHGCRLWRAGFVADESATDWLVRHGRPIAYGYLAARFPLADYQTVFASRDGSAEMPSAGRPFTADLVTNLVRRGVIIAPITLHTGVSSQEAGEPPHTEWFSVPESTARLVNVTRAAGRRIVAVGTTVTRALESAATPNGMVQARAGWTDVVVGGDRPARVVNGLITGLHDPEASHLLLVEAIAGAALTQRAYDAAVQEQYLWHEFGDSCLLLP